MIEFCTKRELAAQLRLCTRQIDKLCAAGLLPRPHKFGRSARWRVDEVEAFLAKNRKPAVQP